MAEKIVSQRRLFIHKAHTIVGVLAEAPIVRPFCRIADSPEVIQPASPIRLALATWQQDMVAKQAMLAFRELVADRIDLDINPIELDAIAEGQAQIDEAEGIVLFDRGLQLARHESDLEPPRRIDPQFASQSDTAGVEIRLAANFEQHSIARGVFPFLFHKTSLVWGVRTPSDASVLLTATAGEHVWPVAWVRHRRHGRAFCTALGASEDFRCPGFVQLITNAIDWVFH